jgi:hypothetical protein
MNKIKRVEETGYANPQFFHRLAAVLDVNEFGPSSTSSSWSCRATLFSTAIPLVAGDANSPATRTAHH